MSKKVRIMGGFQDTRSNGEDFALTPYFFGVWTNYKSTSVRGLGICWGFYSVYLGLGFNIPSNYPSFKVITRPKKEEQKKD